MEYCNLLDYLFPSITMSKLIHQRRQSSSTSSSCIGCPSISPCSSCSKSEICQQIFRPSGSCSTCPVNVCMRFNGDLQGAKKKKSKDGVTIGLPIVGVVLLGLVIGLAWRWWMVRRRRRSRGQSASASASGGGGRTVFDMLPVTKQEKLAPSQGKDTLGHQERDQDGYEDGNGNAQLVPPAPYGMRMSTACASHLSRITEHTEQVEEAEDGQRSMHTTGTSIVSNPFEDVIEENPFDDDNMVTTTGTGVRSSLATMGSSITTTTTSGITIPIIITRSPPTLQPPTRRPTSNTGSMASDGLSGLSVLDQFSWSPITATQDGQPPRRISNASDWSQLK